jgi:predicted ATPase/predicted negative regulator of RcsB-dependent stress response
LLSVWEDLHWVDPSTLELLDLIVRQAPQYRALMVLTFRPEFASLWNDSPHVTRLTATRLLKDDVENVLTRIAGGKSLPPEVVREIVDKTDGVPLFIEELTRMVVESGLLVEYDDSYKLAGPLPPLAIPATLHDSLMARLDQIPNTRKVAQQASTIGREFRTDLLRIISRLDPETLRNELDQMIAAELVYLGAADSHETYIFKHALIHETAYHSLLRSSRQQYHQRIAAALEQEFPETVETQPELLAHHFMVAGLKDQSIFYWERAAERAIQRSANKEAIAHLKQAIELLTSTAETSERAGREVVLQSRLAVALMLSRGYTSSEVQQAYARARELCGVIGDTPRLYPVLWGLWAFYLVRAEYNSSIEIGSQLLALAEKQNDTDLLIEAHASHGLNFFYRGEFKKSKEHLEEVLAQYDADAHRSHALVYGQDPAVASLSMLMWNLWIQGYPDQAAQRCEMLLRLANETGHQYSLAYALSCGATFRQYRREVELGKDLAERGIALSNDQGFLFFSLAATYTLGWALGQLGRGDEALKLLRPAAESWRALGSRLTGPHQLGLLADVLSRVGLSDEAHQVLNQALEDVHETREEYYEAELYRLRGEVFLSQTNPDLEAAEAAFAHSIEVAQRQGAKSWELRTSMSLARLWRTWGRAPQAARMLAQIYGWFTEGLATPDLVDARALLAELG